MLLRKALTLLELVVVLSVLAALSGMLLPLFTGTIQNANELSTVQTLVAVRDAVADYWRDTKHVPLDGVLTVGSEADRLHVDWLFANPVTGDAIDDFAPSTGIGWRGPYIFSPTGPINFSGYPSMIDAWNNAIVIQDVDATAPLRDVRIVSGGPNGIVETPANVASSVLSTADTGDDVYVILALR